MQTYDQQLYAIACQVKWSSPNEFQNHCLSLGGFHTQCCFIASIGKLRGSAGLRDLLVDSDVYAGATVDQILQGKQCNRSMQCLTLVYEILMQIWLTSWVKWLIREDLFKTIPSIVCTQLQEAHRLFLQKEGGTPQLSIRELESLIEEHIMPLIDQCKTSSMQVHLYLSIMICCCRQFKSYFLTAEPSDVGIGASGSHASLFLQC